MHGNMVFSTHYILGTAQQSGGFLVCSDKYGIFNLKKKYYKMAAGGHFGCSKITFDCISGHFRSIGHFGYLKFTFDLDVRNSLSMAFLAI